MKTLIFRIDIKDGDNLVYAKGETYPVYDEDRDNYYTGDFGEIGIAKSWDAIAFFVLNR